MGKSTDFRYNTGATRVPWAAVGENYNVHDLMEIIRFLMQGEGKEYDAALEAVWQQVKKLDALATPPGKLSLGHPQVLPVLPDGTADGHENPSFSLHYHVSGRL